MTLSPTPTAPETTGDLRDAPCIMARDTFPDRRGDWMQTYTGRRFWPLDPKPEDVAIEDIAHALSLQTRYGGHCLRFYSVAEHCVHLVRAAPPELALWLLLHDAAEAYLNDMVRPLKRHMPEYREAEDRVAWAIYERFDLDPGNEPRAVKEFDNRILMDERAQIMRPTDDAWNYGGAVEPLDITIEGWPPLVAERAFLDLFSELTGQSVATPTTPHPTGDVAALRALSETATPGPWRGALLFAENHTAENFDLADAAVNYVRTQLAGADTTAAPGSDGGGEAIGWLFHNPDTGTEWSENHPVESGEVDDATDIRPATAGALREEMLAAWQQIAEQDAALSRQSATGAGRLDWEAFEPFVAHYEPWMDEHGDDDFAPMARITFGSLRRARAALAHIAAGISADVQHRVAKDAAERAGKNAGVAPHLLYAPILWAIEDAALSRQSAPASGQGGNLRDRLEIFRGLLFEPYESGEGYRLGDKGTLSLTITNAEARAILATPAAQPTTGGAAGLDREADKKLCFWGGGNDVIWCATCGAEYAYAKGEQRPPCPRLALPADQPQAASEGAREAVARALARHQAVRTQDTWNPREPMSEESLQRAEDASWEHWAGFAGSALAAITPGGRGADAGSWRHPEGWRLVPDEPTEAMYSAGYDATRKEDGYPQFADAGFCLGHSGNIYRAMLAAAPTAPTAQGEDR